MNLEKSRNVTFHNELLPHHIDNLIRIGIGKIDQKEQDLRK
jgi:hypothetical protein